MVEVTEETVEQLQNIAENTETPMEEVQEQFKEKYEEVDERAAGLSDEKVEEIALRQYRAQITTANRIPTDEIEMLTVGGDIRDTSNGDMFFGTAVVDEDPENDGTEPKLASVRIFDESLAHEIYEAFDHVGNVVTGDFAVDDGDLTNHVEVRNSDDTEFEVHRPNDRSGLVDEIRSVVPETSIATIADDIVSQSRGEDGNMYDVGSDIRRIEATVYDGYKNEDTGTGIYTLRDNTVFDEQDVVESPVFNAEEANENATPGLTCFFDPNKMEWGSEAIVEFFGTVQKNDEDGTIQFSADGAVPVMPNEDGFDGYEDSEDESPERENIGGNVDRTTI